MDEKEKKQLKRFLETAVHVALNGKHFTYDEKEDKSQKKPRLKRYDVEVVIPSITAQSPEEAIEAIAEFYPIRKDWVVAVYDSETKKEVEF